MKLIQQLYFSYFLMRSSFLTGQPHSTNIQCPKVAPFTPQYHRFKSGDSFRRSHGQSAKGRTSGAQICSSSSYCGTASFEPLDQGMSRCGMLGRDLLVVECFLYYDLAYVNVHVIDLVRLHVRMVEYRKKLGVEVNR